MMQTKPTCKRISMTIDLSAFATLAYLKHKYKLNYAEITSALLSNVSASYAEAALSIISEKRNQYAAYIQNNEAEDRLMDKVGRLETDCINSETLAELLGKGSAYGLLHDDKDSSLIF